MQVSLLQVPAGVTFEATYSRGELSEIRTGCLLGKDGQFSEVNPDKMYAYSQTVTNMLPKQLPTKEMSIWGVLTYGVSKPRRSRAGNKNGDDVIDYYDEGVDLSALCTGEVHCQSHQLKASLYAGMSRLPVLYLMHKEPRVFSKRLIALNTLDGIQLPQHMDKNIHRVSSQYATYSMFMDHVNRYRPFERMGFSVILSRLNHIDLPTLRYKGLYNLPYGARLLYNHTAKDDNMALVR